MCIQCVGEGATYVAGAVGALHVMKVRAAHRLRSTAGAHDAAAPADDGAPDGAREGSRPAW